MEYTQRQIINTLEARGCYVLAEETRTIFADKGIRRQSKIEAINLAAEIRDKLEAHALKLLKVAIGPGFQDIAELLMTDFDRLEDKFNKMLTDYLEFRSNQEGIERTAPENVPSKKFEKDEPLISKETEILKNRELED